MSEASKAEKILPLLRDAIAHELERRKLAARIEELLAGPEQPESVRCSTEKVIAEYIDGFACDFDTVEGFGPEDVDQLFEDLAEAKPLELPRTLLITEDWLRSVGFKWHQLERQPEKHWLLWLGGCLVDGVGRHRMFTDYEDLGLELAECNDNTWYCWLRGDTAGRYHRFIHIRHLAYQSDLISLIEGLTGQKWDPTNNLWGSMRTPEAAAQLRKESERLDLRMRQQATRWAEVEKDDSRGRALPEHMEAAIKSGLAK